MTDNPYHPPDSSLDGDSLEDEGVDLDDWATPDDFRRWLANQIDQILFIVAVLPFFIVLLMFFEESVIMQIPDQVLGIVLLVPAGLLAGACEGSRWHATPGKMIFGMRVVLVDGRYPTMGEAIKRNLAKWLGLGICGLLAFTVFGDDRRRGAWDALSGTRVVRRNPYA